jgi:hypothetical protein
MRQIIHLSLLCSALLGAGSALAAASGVATATVVQALAQGASVGSGVQAPVTFLCTPGAERTNQPVNYAVTRIIGQQINSGQQNVLHWGRQILGQLLNYDAYTTEPDEKAILAASLPSCGAGGNACDFTQAGQAANLNATSLLGQLGLNGNPQRTAALTWIQKITNPNVSYPQDASVYNDPKNKSKGLSPDGISYFAVIFKQLPTLSLAQNSFASIFAERDRLPGLAGSTGVGSGGAASILEMMDYEAARRYMAPCWYDAMVGGTDQAVMREIAFMLAFQNYMSVKSYEQNQRIEALMAAQLSTSTGLMSSANMANSPANQKKIQKKANSYSASPP